MEIQTEEERQQIAQVRTALFNDIQMVVAGTDPKFALPALCDALAVTIDMVAPDLETARETMKRLVPGLMRSVDNNWDIVQAHKGSVPAATGEA
jgi:hypothetical protein